MKHPRLASGSPARSFSYASAVWHSRPRSGGSSSQSGCGQVRWELKSSAAPAVVGASPGSARWSSTAVRERVAVRWPTPTSQDAAGSGSAGYSTASGRSEGVTLTDATVRASRLGLPTVTAGESGSPQEAPRQRLNPAFVEALMGLPPGWSLPTIGSGASGMRSFLSRQRRLLASLLGG